MQLCFNRYGVVHKWRHAVFDDSWHPLPPGARFLVKRLMHCCHKIIDTPSPGSKAVTSFMDGPYDDINVKKNRDVPILLRTLSAVVSWLPKLKLLKKDEKIDLSKCRSLPLHYMSNLWYCKILFWYLCTWLNIDF